jgi:hypothetical protein
MTVTVIAAGSALTSAKTAGGFRLSPDRYFFRQYFMQMTYSLLHASRV